MDLNRLLYVIRFERKKETWRYISCSQHMNCEAYFVFFNRNLSNLMSLTSFLGKLSSLTSQIVLRVVRKERDSGHAAQLNLLRWPGSDTSRTQPVICAFLKAPNWECTEKVSGLKIKITWALSYKLDESVLSWRFIGFNFSDLPVRVLCLRIKCAFKKLKY